MDSDLPKCYNSNSIIMYIKLFNVQSKAIDFFYNYLIQFKLTSEFRAVHKWLCHCEKYWNLKIIILILKKKLIGPLLQFLKFLYFS